MADAFDAGQVRANLDKLYAAIRDKRVLSAWALGLGGAAEGAMKMALGNRVGAELWGMEDPFRQDFGALLLEMAPGETLGETVGRTTAEYALCFGGERVALDEVQALYEGALEEVFPYRGEGPQAPKIAFEASQWPKPAVTTGRPAAFVPVFPGTNCEVDTALRSHARRRAAAAVADQKPHAPDHRPKP